MIFKNKKSYLILLMLFQTLILNCEKSTSGNIDDNYINQIKLWHIQRIERLKANDGWLSLAGLFWLEEGKNTFGSGSSNDFIIHKENIPINIGEFLLEHGSVRFKTSQGVGVFHQNRPILDIILENDTSGNPTLLNLKSLSWYIIKRGERLGVRVKDSEHPRIKHLKKIEKFSIDAAWRIKAVLENFESPRVIKTPTVLGYIEEESSPGVLVFQLRGKKFSLYPFNNNKGYFIVFGDLTNTHETYGGGRFLEIKKPDENGNCWIDFNQAYNPPCVFSPYATCPLPPEENQLQIRITAGEKMVKGFGH